MSKRMKTLNLFTTTVLFFIVLLLISQPSAAQATNESHQTLMHTFLGGLRWGFISVLQPCLYAMFPVTVTFFLKRSQSRMQGIKNASLYSFSIVAIFTVFAFFLP